MKLIQEMGAVSLGVGITPIGILVADYPTWAWYVGAMGKIKWMISGLNFPGQMEGDSVRYKIGDSLDGLEDVEVLLIQGDWSLIDDRLWTIESLKTILKFETGGGIVKSGRAKRRRVSANVPDSWRVGGRRIIHQGNGGVTDGIFKFEWDVCRGHPDVPPSVSAKLSQILSQMDSSGKEAIEPEEGEDNLFHGILNWNKMDEEVITKHVFGEDKWVKRCLSIKEKAECLDFPNTRTASMTEELINLLSKFEVPEKILVASLWYLTHDAGKVAEGQ